MKKRLTWSKVVKIFYVIRRMELWIYALKGIFPATEHIDAFKIFKATDVDGYLDVGANVGQFALMVMINDKDKEMVFIEPLEHCMKYLKYVSERLIHSRLINAGLGRAKGEMRIWHASEIDSSSFLKLTQLQESTFGVTGTSRWSDAKILRGDDVTKNLDMRNGVLKIDVQGYELEVLMGMTNVKKFFRFIYIETSFVELYRGQALFNDVYQHIVREGYTLASFWNPHYIKNGCLAQADFLFQRVFDE